MQRRVNHPLYLDQWLQQPTLVVAERLQKLAAPDMLQNAAVLRYLLPQGSQPPCRFQ